jgi:hypothetical protein
MTILKNVNDWKLDTGFFCRPCSVSGKNKNFVILLRVLHCLNCNLFRKRFNPYTANCENAMALSVPGIPVSCEKFPHSSQLNFLSTESIFNQFSVFLKTLNALCVCLQYKHPRSIKRVIRSDKPATLLLLLWSHKCDFGAEPRSRIIATGSERVNPVFVIIFKDNIKKVLNSDNKKKVHKITNLSMISGMLF